MGKENAINRINVYVVVNFLSQAILFFFRFRLWKCMLMKLKQKKNKNYLR